MIAWLACGDGARAQVTRGTIAFVNYEQVFTNYFKSRLATEQLNDMRDNINRERAILLLLFDKTQEELKNLRQRVVAEDLSPEARDQLRRQVDEKLVEVRNVEERVNKFNDTQERLWSEQQRRIRGNLMREINEKLRALLKARGYLAVVDSSQASDKGVPAVLYLDERADITAEMITELNK